MRSSDVLSLPMIDAAAKELARSSRVFTTRNLFHAARRRARLSGRPKEGDLEAFCCGVLAERLRIAPIPGLLAPPAIRARTAHLPREWDAYFPAGILLVDHAPIVDLFAASGVLVQARIAVVSLDGYPAHVTDWLRRGLRAGKSAPTAFLHDAATVVYPFAFEPLATCAAIGSPGRLAYRDLGLPPDGATERGARRRVFELEEVVPGELVAGATRALLSMLPRDAALAPLIQEPHGGLP